MVHNEPPLGPANGCSSPLAEDFEIIIDTASGLYCIVGIIVENVDIDGSLVDCFEGRQVTPGHAIEAMWFIMDLGKRLNRPELIEKAKETL